jgi:hypothetical protein
VNKRQRAARRAKRVAEEGISVTTDTASSPVDGMNNTLKSNDNDKPTNNQETSMTTSSVKKLVPGQVQVVGPPPPAKRFIDLHCYGAHEGAKGNVPAVAEFNERSASVQLVPVYVDPVPGRALEMKERAERLGVLAKHVEARAEDLLATQSLSDPQIVHIDRASGVASVLRAASSSRAATLAYMLVKLPNGKLYGLAAALTLSDESVRNAAIVFFEELARASERNTSSDVVGDGGDPAHTLMEPQIRAWFRRHTVVNLTKAVAGLELSTNALELTEDGTESVPLFVVVRQDWAQSQLALAEEVIGNPAMPIRKGAKFVIAEVVQGKGIRLHHARRRSDDKVTIGGAIVVDRSDYERAVAAARRTKERTEAKENEAIVTDQERELAKRALAVVALAAVSAANPVLTTD